MRANQVPAQGSVKKQGRRRRGRRRGGEVAQEHLRLVNRQVDAVQPPTPNPSLSLARVPAPVP